MVEVAHMVDQATSRPTDQVRATTTAEDMDLRSIAKRNRHPAMEEAATPALRSADPSTAVAVARTASNRLMASKHHTVSIRAAVMVAGRSRRTPCLAASEESESIIARNPSKLQTFRFCLICCCRYCFVPSTLACT